MEDVGRVFNKMPSGDVVDWNFILLGNAKCGQGQKAPELFQKLEREVVRPSSATFVPQVVTAWAGVITLEEGRCIYEDIFESG
jgi:hypothetical protein